MKMKRYASFDEYLADQPARNQTIIRALRRFVKRVVTKRSDIDEAAFGALLRQAAK